MAENNLESNNLWFYRQITKGLEHNHVCEYVSPEEQGRSLKSYSILEATDVEYNNSTKLN